MSKRALWHAEPDGQMGQFRSVRALALCSLVAAGTALLYFFALAGLQPAGKDRPWLWPLVALGVWAAYSQPVALRNRQFSLAIALSEIPGLVGIAFLPPGFVLAAVSVGHIAASAQRRIHPLKGLVNWLMYAAGVGAGIWAYDHAIGGASPASGRGWLVAVGTISLINLVDLLLLLAVMAVVDTRWRRPPLRSIAVQGGVGIGVNSAGGLVAVSLGFIDTWGILLFVAIAGAANLAYRATVRSGQRYANLEKLYEFTRQLGTLVEGRDVMATVLEESRTLLSAHTAELVVPLVVPGDRRVASRASVAGEGPVEWDLTSALSTLDELALARGALLVDEAAKKDDAGLAAAMARHGLKEALVAPLQRDDPSSGYLLVADRAYRHEGFDQKDLRFFEAVAANAGVSLRSSKLLGQLRREAAERQQQAEHDALTGLPNRTLFVERLDQAIELCRPGDRVAVMIIDLDGFKDVNDTLGHQTGDSILGEVAKRLSPLGRGGDVVARLGGDEFAVLVSRAPSDEQIGYLANELITSVHEPVAVEDLLLDVRASLGVAVFPQHSQDGSSLLRQADIAMYAAKSAGGGYRFYDKAEDRSTLRRLRLATELRRAMNNDDLDIWYQPMVNIFSGAVIGCEALLRWSHDQFGPISPVEFVPVAESAGLIDPLTFWVLKKALTQAKQWRRLVPDLCMAVNLSARTLMSLDIPSRLRAVLDEVGIEPSALTLELTESSTLADPVASQKILVGLTELGVNLSIDDYGTGFSSLSRLKHLPFDELKIDRSFVKEMITDKGDEAIVRSTIELARYLGRTVVAEGVEDQATLQALEALGCDAAQGFFLARPLPAPQCEAWLLAASAALGNTTRVPLLRERAERGDRAAKPARQRPRWGPA